MVSPTQQGILIVQPDSAVVGVAASANHEVWQWPVWSPDGSRLAYVDPEHGISVVDSSGLHPRRIAPPCALRPSWSPDGSKIAYIRTMASTEGTTSVASADTPADTELIAVSAEGGDPVSLIRRTATVGTLRAGSAEFGTPAWSPDGSTIAVHWEDVRFAEPESASVDAILAATQDGEREFVYAERNASGPGVWSLDGLAFYYPGAGPIGDQPGIYRANADGTGQHLVSVAQHPWDLMLSPNGSQLAYADRAGVFVLSLDDAIRRRVVSWDEGGDLTGWSPEADRLLFWVQTDQAWSDLIPDRILHLRVVNADGSGLTTIARRVILDSFSPLSDVHAEWRPTDTP